MLGKRLILKFFMYQTQLLQNMFILFEVQTYNTEKVNLKVLNTKNNDKTIPLLKYALCGCKKSKFM